MNKYEITIVLSPSATEEKRDIVLKKFTNFIEKQKGTVTSVEKQGLKKLAYPIKFKNEGFYVLLTFEGVGKICNELEKLMLITEEVLRCMFIKV